MLPSFLNWARVANNEACLYDITISNVNRRAAGQKGGKPRRSRSATATTASVPPQEWLPRLTRTRVASPAADASAVHHQQVVASSTYAHYNPNPFVVHQPEIAAGQRGARPSSRSTTTNTVVCVDWQEWLHGGTNTSTAPPAPSNTAICNLLASNLIAVRPPEVQQPPNIPRHVNLYQGNVGERKPCHNSNPFVILLLTARVNKCTGCPFEFRDPLGPSFSGLVVQHREKDIYRGKDGQLHVSNESNHYYHCEPSCILQRHPYFNSRFLVLAPEIMLDPAQSAMLHLNFGL